MLANVGLLLFAVSLALDRLIEHPECPLNLFALVIHFRDFWRHTLCTLQAELHNELRHDGVIAEAKAMRFAEQTDLR